MTTQAHKFPRFFVTAPSPCPYLPGKVERKVFTDLTGADSTKLNEALSRIGFRRSQSVAYRPSCENCNACVSVRILAQPFRANASMRKLHRRHSDLERKACEPWATDEQYDLLRRYLASRHPTGGMSEMDAEDFVDMIERTTVPTVVYEYREPASGDDRGRLVGVCLTDVHSDGLSMVYSFFEPGGERKGLGSYIILDHVEIARQRGLPHVYLGYWIDGCKSMSYKRRFQPLEQLTNDGWTSLPPDA